MSRAWAFVACGAAAALGCWRTDVVAPAVAADSPSTGYGVVRHTFNAGLAAAAIQGVGVVAHSPAEAIGEAGDSLWLVVDRTALELCVWSARGVASCERATWEGDAPGGDPIRIVDPINLGAVLTATTTYNSQTGQVETSSNNVPIFLVESSDFVADRAIWVLNGSARAMWRCAITGGKPACRTVRL